MRRFGPMHDVILFHTKTEGNGCKWNGARQSYMKGHVESYFVQDEQGWRTNYYGNVLTGSGMSPRDQVRLLASERGLSAEPSRGRPRRCRTDLDRGAPVLLAVPVEELQDKASGVHDQVDELHREKFFTDLLKSASFCCGVSPTASTTSIDLGPVGRLSQAVRWAFVVGYALLGRPLRRHVAFSLEPHGGARVRDEGGSLAQPP